MTKNKILVSVASLALLAGAGATSVVWARQLPTDEQIQNQQAQARQEQGQKMKEIFDNKDFQSWQTLTLQHATDMEQKAAKIRESATQENFDKMVQAHQLMSEGKVDEARKIMQDLGMMKFGKRPFCPVCLDARHEKMMCNAEDATASGTADFADSGE